MASIGKVITTISELTGVSEQKVTFVARRLGEAKMFPSGPRGRNAPDLNAIHIARILVGVMALSEGYSSTVATTPRTVRQVERQRSTGPDVPDHFVRYVAECIESEDFLQLMGVKAISLRFYGDAVIGVAHDERRTGLMKSGPMMFLDWKMDIPDNVGLFQDVTVGVDVLRNLGELVPKKANRSKSVRGD